MHVSGHAGETADYRKNGGLFVLDTLEGGCHHSQMVRGLALGALPPFLLFLSEVRGHSLLLHREVGLHLRDGAPLQCGECLREQQILVVSLDNYLVDGGEVAELL